MGPQVRQAAVADAAQPAGGAPLVEPVQVVGERPARVERHATRLAEHRACEEETRHLGGCVRVGVLQEKSRPTSLPFRW